MVRNVLLIALLALALPGIRSQEFPGFDMMICDPAKLSQMKNLAAQIYHLISTMSTSSLECTKETSGLPTPVGYPYPVIYPAPGSAIKKPYLCDTTTEQGGWIVIQLRRDGNLDFYRNWADNKAGFGDLDGNFWLGLDAIHELTKSGNYELRVDLKFKGSSYYAKYGSFSIASESDNYRLSVGSYSGTAGDSLTHDDGMQFSTKDRDHDKHPNDKCADIRKGGWWYNFCGYSNLNGMWGVNDQFRWSGLVWWYLTKHETVSYSEMKIRRVDNVPM